MAAKKGQIPAHVKKKSFTHPGLEHPLIQAIERVEDERKPSQFFRYSLTSVIFVLNYLLTLRKMSGISTEPKPRS